MNIWNEVKHLFEKDDGSLPDIFISNLTNQELIAIYEWLMSQCEAPQKTTVWSIEKECDVFLHEVPSPASSLCEGRIEYIKHPLEGLSINGILLPLLCIWVFSNEIIIDYRMGNEWSDKKVLALFDLLRCIQQIAPIAPITQADEGDYECKNTEFSQAFKAYCSNA